MIRRAEAEARDQLAAKPVPRLGALLESTATLAPRLAVGNWQESLPREGGANLASGCVRRERLDDLIAALRQLQAEGDLPYETGDRWAEIVVAAAETARRAQAHLVEADDAIYGALRWPPIGNASR